MPNRIAGGAVDTRRRSQVVGNYSAARVIFHRAEPRRPSNIGCRRPHALRRLLQPVKPLAAVKRSRLRPRIHAADVCPRKGAAEGSAARLWMRSRRAVLVAGCGTAEAQAQASAVGRSRARPFYYRRLSRFSRFKCVQMGRWPTNRHETSPQDGFPECQPDCLRRLDLQLRAGTTLLAYTDAGTEKHNLIWGAVPRPAATAALSLWKALEKDFKVLRYDIDLAARGNQQHAEMTELC
jgi:hypothetical protein